MRVAMIGAGYVGLVSATCFSEFGFSVTCVDAEPERIAALRAGRVPIYEPGLEALLAANVAAGRLSFTEDIADAVSAADVVMLAVGTPSRRGDGHADLSFVFEAARQVCGRSRRLHRRRDEIDRARRHRARDCAHHSGTPPGCLVRCGLEPRVPA